MNGPIQQRSVQPLSAAVLMRKNVELMQLCILHLLSGESAKCQSVLPRMRGARRARSICYAGRELYFLWIQDPCCAMLLIDGIVSYLNKFVHHLLLRSSINSIVNLYCCLTAANINVCLKRLREMQREIFLSCHLIIFHKYSASHLPTGRGLCVNC